MPSQAPRFCAASQARRMEAVEVGEDAVRSASMIAYSAACRSRLRAASRSRACGLRDPRRDRAALEAPRCWSTQRRFVAFQARSARNGRRRARAAAARASGRRPRSARGRRRCRPRARRSASSSACSLARGWRHGQSPAARRGSCGAALDGRAASEARPAAVAGGRLASSCRRRSARSSSALTGGSPCLGALGRRVGRLGCSAARRRRAWPALARRRRPAVAAASLGRRPSRLRRRRRSAAVFLEALAPGADHASRR